MVYQILFSSFLQTPREPSEGPKDTLVDCYHHIYCLLDRINRDFGISLSYVERFPVGRRFVDIITLHYTIADKAQENCTGDYAVNFQRQTLLANMLMDVFTDILSKPSPSTSACACTSDHEWQ